jgi:DNA mismatch repair protein MSH3
MVRQTTSKGRKKKEKISSSDSDIPQERNRSVVEGVSFTPRRSTRKTRSQVVMLHTPTPSQYDSDSDDDGSIIEVEPLRKKARKKKDDDDDYVPDERQIQDDQEDEDDLIELENECEEGNGEHASSSSSSSSSEEENKRKRKKKQNENSTENEKKRKKKLENSTTSAPAIRFDPFVYMYNPANPAQITNAERHKLFIEKLLSNTLSHQTSDINLNDEDIISDVSGDESIKNKRKDAKKKGSMSSKVKYTPLEEQVIKLKREYPSVILFVEVGYKFMLFGDDALHANKTLGLVVFNKGNFQCACIPTHRLSYHLRRMVLAGYKCGVVRQTETAAIKADNAKSKSAQPFMRELTSMYTTSTLIGEDIGDMDEGIFSHLVIIYETIIDAGNRTAEICLVCVDVTTGHVLYEKPFYDQSSRQELETRLCKIQPVEILLPRSVSKETERVVREVTCRTNVSPRIDFYQCDRDKKAIEQYLRDFFLNYAEDDESLSQDQMDHSSEKQQLEHILSLSQSLRICFYKMIEYLKDFKLAHLLKLPNMRYHSFENIGAMNLNSITLKNLEILQNSTDGSIRGSLYYIMDRTRTKFGARLLKSWITHPLTDVTKIQQRLDAIDTIHSHCSCVDKMIDIMKGLPDLERILMKIFYNKISAQEFLKALTAFQRIFENIPEESLWKAELKKGSLLYQIFEEIPLDLLSFIKAFLDSFSHQAAKDGVKSALFIKQSISNDTNLVTGSICGYIASYYSFIKEAKKRLDQELEYVRKLFKKPNMTYKTYKNFKYVIEIPIAASKNAPKDWIKLGQTKTLVRYHTKSIIEQVKIIELNEDKLEIESHKAWIGLLKQFSTKYSSLKKCIDQFAILDCLNSLAEVSIGQGYVKPIFVDDREGRVLEIVNGRHPIIETILSDRDYVPNSVTMNNGKRIYICTGPNMAGKSSFIRQVSLIVLMAQIGCYVPAESCRLSVCDSIFTRMGACDNITRGQSTFFVELAETSEILHHATQKSLVLLDEIGRGTSTYDGYSIAHAILTKLIELGCFTLFVTHYPLLTHLENTFSCVSNFHMDYSAPTGSANSNQSNSNDIMLGEKGIKFLYKLVPGAAEKSYGINVARLAGIPSSVIELADNKSKQEEEKMRQRVSEYSFMKMLETMGRAANNREELKKCQILIQQLSPLFH